MERGHTQPGNLLRKAACLLPDSHEDRTSRSNYSQEALWKKVCEKQRRLLYTLNDVICRTRREVRAYLEMAARN